MTSLASVGGTVAFYEAGMYQSLGATRFSGEVFTCDLAPGFCQADNYATADADVAALATCGAHLYGDLTLNGEAITDLSPLEALEEIHGDLVVGLLGHADLTGLDSLRVVHRDLRLGILEENRYLPFVASAAGLDSLETVGGALELWDRFAVHDFQGMASLTSVERIRFGWESGVTSFKGLEGLTVATIDNYPRGLASFAGLDNLLELRGEVGVVLPLPGAPNNTVSLQPLANLTYLSVLAVDTSEAFPPGEFANLSRVETLGALSVAVSDPAFVDLSAMTAVGLIEEDVYLDSRVTGLDEMFANIKRIGGQLDLGANISDASFLSGLESIGYGMRVLGLSDFSGFSSLKSIGDNLSESFSGTNVYLSQTGNRILLKCGMESLEFVAGEVRCYGQNGWTDEDATTYFDPLPQPQCGM